MKKLAISIGLAVALYTGNVEAKIVKSMPKTASVLLNNSISVDSQHVLLSDIFSGISQEKDKPVAFAPRPGKKMTFEARWLYRIALVNDINWKPETKFDRVTVKRSSQIIDRESIIYEIQKALVEQGVSEDAEITLNNRSIAVHVPVDADVRINISNISYNKRLRRFSAVVEGLNGTSDAFQMRVSGRIFDTTVIPVISKNIPSGKIISADDVEFIKIRSDQLRRNSATNADQLIGMEARRLIRPGTPVQTNDLQRPLMVSKGRIVTMILKTPFMTLTTKGKALENGSKGDVIKIKNIKSGTTIQGVVTNAGRISVNVAETSLAMN